MPGFLAVLLDHPLLLIVRIALLRLPFISAALIIAINNSTAAIFHLRIPPLLTACQQVLLFLALIPPPLPHRGLFCPRANGTAFKGSKGGGGGKMAAHCLIIQEG